MDQNSSDANARTYNEHMEARHRRNVRNQENLLANQDVLLTNQMGLLSYTDTQQRRIRENIDIQQRDINDLFRAQTASEKRVEEVVGQYVSLVEHVGDMADECNELSAVWKDRRIPDRVRDLEYKFERFETWDGKLRHQLVERFKKEDERLKKEEEQRAQREKEQELREKKQEQFQVMFQRCDEMNRKEVKNAYARIDELERELKTMKLVNENRLLTLADIRTQDHVERERNTARLDRLEKLLERSAEENMQLKKRVSDLEGSQKEKNPIEVVDKTNSSPCTTL